MCFLAPAFNKLWCMVSKRTSTRSFLYLVLVITLIHTPFALAQDASSQDASSMAWDLETDEETGEQMLVLKGQVPKRRLEIPRAQTEKLAMEDPAESEFAETGEPEVIVVAPEGYTAPRPARRVQPSVPGVQPSAEPAVVQPTVAGAPVAARPRVAAARPEKPAGPNLVFENFYMTSDQRLQYDTIEVDGFIFAKTPNRKRRTNYSIVTGFSQGVMQSQYITGLSTESDVKKWLDGAVQTTQIGSVDVRRLSIPAGEGQEKAQFWVGNKSFDSAELAQAEIVKVKALVEAQGGNFDEMVQQVRAYYAVPEKEAAKEISKAQFQKEEELVLKWMDQLDIGEKLWGPFHGMPAGEPIIWQSFGETSWRRTNLASLGFRDQVGFWTNRLVFKGIRAPLSTIDPYVQATLAMQSDGVDFADTLILGAGLEWRPFERNTFLQNYRPWGGIPFLAWIRNYRFFVAYFDRKNLKDEIDASDNHNLLAGVDIFYEWGVELPELTEPEPESFADYVREYVWGEYFGLYAFDMTNFGPEDDFDAWIFNSSITLGVRLPGIPLPPNPINNELVLMPYMRFEHVNNTQFSFPFQNRYFVATGVRWMPFRNYRYKENEWFSKTKIFAEFVGVGKAQHARVSGEEVPHAVRWDLRFGVNISSRRF